MKKLLIAATIVFVSCVRENENKSLSIPRNDSIKNDQSYPIEIILQGLQKWHDKTKWTLYCIYCDDTCNFQEQTNIQEVITFASLNLKFEAIRQFNDTTEIIFAFYYKDTLKCDVSTVRNLRLATGAGFIKGSDSIYYYTSSSTMSKFWEGGLKSRYQYPLQPEMVTYLNKNREKLYPWFREEAIRKKVIK